MTAQVPDSIFCEGCWRELACEPLRPWLARRKNSHLRFRPGSSACQRGYRSEWMVERGRLFLTRFSARLPNGQAAEMSMLFENYSVQFYKDCHANESENQGPGRFAFWVTGTLRCRLGRLLRYEHMGYESLYEAELHLVFDRGLLVGQRIVHHSEACQSLPEEHGFGEPAATQGAMGAN